MTVDQLSLHKSLAQVLSTNRQFDLALLKSVDWDSVIAIAKEDRRIANEQSDLLCKALKKSPDMVIRTFSHGHVWIYANDYRVWSKYRIVHTQQNQLIRMDQDTRRTGPRTELPEFDFTDYEAVVRYKRKLEFNGENAYWGIGASAFAWTDFPHEVPRLFDSYRYFTTQSGIEFIKGIWDKLPGAPAWKCEKLTKFPKRLERIWEEQIKEEEAEEERKKLQEEYEEILNRRSEKQKKREVASKLNRLRRRAVSCSATEVAMIHAATSLNTQ